MSPRLSTRDVVMTPAPLVDGLGTRSRAYVQVQNGCDHRCTFCIIPYGRGNARSVPAATVTEQIRRLVGRGFNEVVLTGVDLTSWGADLEGRARLGDLVAAVLAAVPDLPRLRLSSIDSVEADPRLMEAIGAERPDTRYVVTLDAGAELIVTQQNLATTSTEALAQQGRPVRLAWKRQHCLPVADGRPSEEEEHPG